MIMEIKHYNEVYLLNIEPITQLLGQNISKKSFVFKSIRKHFSTTKYSDYEEYMIDNICVDNRVPGRNYYIVYSISSRDDLINELKLKRAGLTRQWISYIINEYDFQIELNEINGILGQIFKKINDDFLEDTCKLCFNYQEKATFDMIQESNIVSVEDKELESLTNFELLRAYLGLLMRINMICGQKLLILIENIDHFVSKQEYMIIFQILKNLTISSDITIITSTSLDGFCYVDKATFTGINVINSNIINMPEYNDMKAYIEDNYPININFEEMDFNKIISGRIHNIGDDGSSVDVRSFIIERIVNEAECVYSNKLKQPSVPEMLFMFD